MNPIIIKNQHLDGNTFFLEGKNKICMMLIHGFTATTVEVKPLAKFLNQAGYHIYAPLLPGHGTSPDDLNNCRWEDWTETLRTEFEKINKDFNKVFVAGESMGGILTCYLAATIPQIQAISLFAPAIKVENLGLSRFIRFFKKNIPKKNNQDTSDEGVYPWQGYSVHPTNGAFQMYLLQKETKKLLHKIKQPAIIFHGKYDKTISFQSSKIIYDTIQSTRKEYIFLENSGHTILLDKEFDFVAKKTLKFIKDNGF
jgi:carboxylesterase